MRILLVLSCFFAWAACAFSQTALRISFEQMGKIKNYEVFTGETLHYKLKGGKKTRHKKVSAIGDSAIYFADDSLIQFGQIKTLYLHKNNFHNRLLELFFRRAGILFMILHAGNNLLLENPQIVSKNAVIITGSLLAASFIIRRLGIIKLRMNGHKTIKKIEIRYNNLK